MLQSAPGFSWASFQQLAETLAKTDSQAHLRSAVSRSYYAVFHEAMAKARTWHFVETRTGMDHDLIVEWWRKFPRPEAGVIATNLKELRYQRRLCDYEATLTIRVRKCETLLATADDTLARVRNIKSGPKQ